MIFNREARQFFALAAPEKRSKFLNFVKDWQARNVPQKAAQQAPATYDDIDLRLRKLQIEKQRCAL
jgi:hypothetical protein